MRTEWIARRAIRELASQAELKMRLERSREKVNAEVAALSRILTLVDYLSAGEAGLDWLPDEADYPIMRTAIAAGVPGILVTDNRRDFPLGEVRNGVLILGADRFLDELYQRYLEAPAAIATYLGRE
ncbi:MAG TPA: hypothetical protein VFZ25_06815 [Chloroflexota bacterium]|nr:hypothetical protein [Chloroflexota bacterium]